MSSTSVAPAALRVPLWLCLCAALALAACSPTSGLDCVGEHDEPTFRQMNASADWAQFALDLKVVTQPGAK